MILWCIARNLRLLIISERPHDLRAVPLLQLLLVGGRQPVQVQAGQRAVVAQRAREEQVAVARERVRVQA